MTATKILMLEPTPNGSYTSLIDDSGRVWGTGGSVSALREAAFSARDAGYEAIMVGAQRWEVAAVCEAW